MNLQPRNPYAAVDPALGYLFQVRCALLWTLTRLPSEPQFLVGIEKLDDVTFETVGGEPADLLQTKHHRLNVGSLTDSSPDLWKTLRIWLEGTATGTIPSTARLWILTTGTAPEGSAASCLRAEGRDVAKAQEALDATVASSTRASNRAAYTAYRFTPPEQRTALLERVVVLDASPTIDDLDGELRKAVYWAAEKEHHDAFLERLEGWWLRRVLQHLCAGQTERIGSVEVDEKMADLRNQFKQDALPIDDDILMFILDDATRAAHEKTTFVRQLELARAGNRRIANAIQDYYRAFQQRSRWLRDELVGSMDLPRYERRLVEEWERVFDAISDELGDEAAEDVMVTAAQSVLKWAEQVPIPIRPQVTAPFVCRGSFHMLSDEVKIGWHPEFRKRLALVILGEEGVG